MTRVIFLNYAIHKVNQSLINDGYCMSPSRHNRKPDTFMYQYLCSKILKKGEVHMPVWQSVLTPVLVLSYSNVPFCWL